MENDLLKLKEDRQKAYDLFQQNEKETIDAIASFIKQHCCSDNVTPLVYLNMDNYRSFTTHGNRYSFVGRIAFKEEDPERLAKGYKEDFGSEFHISIREKDGIRINRGSIGDYGKNNKFQVARDRMIVGLWDNEDTIVGIMNEHFDYTLYDNFNQIDKQIDKIEWDLKQAEEKRKHDEMLAKLKSSKYLWEECTRDEYDYDVHKYTKRIHKIREIMVIDKFTDKNIICHYKGLDWKTKRLDINQTMTSLLYNHKYCGNEVPEDYTTQLPEASN